MTNSPHHPKELSYWDRVTLARETDNHDYLAWIIANESEDDFRAAVADNLISTVEDIRWAAEYHGYWVRERVVANKLCPQDVLVKFLVDAHRTIEEYQEQAKVPSLQRHHYAVLVDDADDLIRVILKELSDRAAASAESSTESMEAGL